MSKIALVFGMICLSITMMGIKANAQVSQAVEKQDVPEQILAAFEKAYPDAKVTAIEKEKAGDQVTYAFEISDGKNENDIIYLEDGTLHSIVEDMPIADLPQAVAESIKKAHPQGEIDEADKITRGAAIEYEVVVEVVEGEAEIVYEIVAAADGKIINEVQLQDDDGDEGAEEEDSYDDTTGGDEEDEG